jgi:hypothetical protein
MNKLAIWKGGALSIARRVALINASLSNSFIYHISIYLMPKTVTSRLDKHKRMFFWQGGCTKKKYRLVRWAVICKSKRGGVWGLKILKK